MTNSTPKNPKPIGKISRRELLKLGGLGLGSLALRPWIDTPFNVQQQDFPQGVPLARNTLEFASIRALPSTESEKIGELGEDEVVQWLREVVGYNPYSFSQRWIETPLGYIWSPLMQPVRNNLNAPISQLPSNEGHQGMWVEVTVPWVSLQLVNQGPQGPFVIRMVQKWGAARAYYSQIWWVDQIKVDENGQTWYRLNEEFSYGDVFWGPAEAFRPISQEEIAPINPEGENKYIEINLHRQTLSAFENGREVFFTRVSTGRAGNDTPVGLGFYPWRKMISSHLSGGSSGAGWDLTGVGFTTFFVSSGVALHSTFWHNNYGEPTSGGCINMRPEDAKWIFRWTTPVVPYYPGDVSTEGYGFGTNIQIISGL